MVKKLISLLLTLCILSTTVYAMPGYEAGIKGEKTTQKNQYYYKEVVFLTGEPVVLEGTITVAEDTKGTKTTVTYNLSNTVKNATLSRKVVFNNTSSKNELGNQTTYSTSVDPRFNETVKIGSDTFVLTEYQFSRSGISDDRTIIQYLVSNWDGRKVYNRNGSSGQVVVEIGSNAYRYDNFWSSTETAVISNSLTYRYKTNATDTNYKEAVGTAEYAVSNSMVKDLEYVANDPRDISFQGGYVLKESQENVVSYKYEIPVMTNWVPNGKRNSGKDSYKMTTVPTQERTFVPTIKDVSSGYWAAEDIKKVISMGIIDVADSNYFRPLGFMNRAEFAKAIAKASDITPDDNKTVKSKSYDMVFSDVDKSNPYYDYIMMVTKTGIMQGTSTDRFSPDEYLTKVQALTIIVRALGLEEASEESSTRTSFSDDSSIQPWAKKSVNVARRMGIVTGNQNNELEPDKVLTRAECASMLNRYIRYLQFDMRTEYREKIINFGR